MVLTTNFCSRVGDFGNKNRLYFGYQLDKLQIPNHTSLVLNDQSSSQTEATEKQLTWKFSTAGLQWIIEEEDASKLTHLQLSLVQPIVDLHR